MGGGGAVISSATALLGGTTFLVPVDADVTYGNGTAGSAVGHVFDGVAITEPGTVLVKYTYVGDLNFDGQVDGTDFALAQGHVGETTAGVADFAAAWRVGDVTLDGVVNGLDLATIAGNYNAGVAPALGPMIVGTSPVPEPGTVGVLGVVAVGLLVRRRRRN